MIFRLENPTTGFVGGYTGTELVERHMNEMSRACLDPITELQAQLQELVEIVRNRVDDLNLNTANVLEIVMVEQTSEEYTHGKL